MSSYVTRSRSQHWIGTNNNHEYCFTPTDSAYDTVGCFYYRTERVVGQYGSLFLIAFLIGVFLYKTYRWLTKRRQKASPWERVQARVIGTQQLKKNELQVELRYDVNGKEYGGTGYTVLYPGQPLPTAIEVVYKPQTPEAWEFGEDHPQESDPHGGIKAIWFWLLIMAIVIGGCVLYALYLTRSGGTYA